MSLELGNVPPQGGSQTPPSLSTYGRWVYLSRVVPWPLRPCLSVQPRVLCFSFTDVQTDGGVCHRKPKIFTLDRKMHP